MELTDRVLKWLTTMKNRPKMIIAEKMVDYRLLKIYLEGYFDGIGHALGIDLRKDITYWFQEKIKEQSSLYWTDQIREYYISKSEEELRIILLNVTEEYFLEHPNWYKISDSHQVHE